jgi:RNA polymerase sigma factor (sigma-70 family)
VTRIVEAWRARLAEGDAEDAWDLFIDRYRRLIIATIGRIVGDDDAADVFAHVCQALSANGLVRLKRYDDASPHRARFSTWLVTVVHNQTIDWVRGHAGRRRVAVPEQLSDLQANIFRCVFVEQRSHTETYEIVRSGLQEDLGFTGFLRELAETYRVVEAVRSHGVMHYLAVPPAPSPLEAGADNRLTLAEIAGRLSIALDSLSAEERLALQLFVVEDMAAADVARIVAWPNAKAVYNRVHRALRHLRDFLERDGIGPADL